MEEGASIKWFREDISQLLLGRQVLDLEGTLLDELAHVEHTDGDVLLRLEDAQSMFPGDGACVVFPDGGGSRLSKGELLEQAPEVYEFPGSSAESDKLCLSG